jgi:hypothetical protein
VSTEGTSAITSSSRSSCEVDGVLVDEQEVDAPHDNSKQILPYLRAASAASANRTALHHCLLRLVKLAICMMSLT